MANNKRAMLRCYGFVVLVLAPVVLAVVLYRVEPLDPAQIPQDGLSEMDMVVPHVNSKMLRGAELVGVGQLEGPEDFALDPNSQLVYASCADGWIKRVMVNNSLVQNWVNVGSRPLGLALGLSNELIVADPFQGLLNVSEEGKVEVLADEVEGRKLKFADGVDVAKDGMIYFSEASYKYGLQDFAMDFFEGRPYGSLMSFDPTTRQTKLLLSDLYFANGVQVSADQKSVIFCETYMRRCKRYIIEGERKGSVEIFVDNLPGFPDNIRYDDQEGYYWIALATSSKPYWHVAMKYPLVRKALAIITRYIGRPNMEKNGGFMTVDLEGKPVAHYYDPSLTAITCAKKIGDYIYCGSLSYPYIIRLNLALHAAS